MTARAYDAIIVGASFAGLAVARELSGIQVHDRAVVHTPTRTVIYDASQSPSRSTRYAVR